MNFICDNLMAEKKAEECIVVMCNGMIGEENEEGINLSPFDAFEKVLTEEVIPYIDSHFRTLKDKKHRAMAGLSMGSMQTSYMTLRRPELFAYARLFSGFVSNFLTGENEHLEHLDEYKESLNVYFRAMADRDPFLKMFLHDDELLKKHEISCVRKIYFGGHEWKVWRRCLNDFLPLLFR